MKRKGYSKRRFRYHEEGISTQKLINKLSHVVSEIEFLSQNILQSVARGRKNPKCSSEIRINVLSASTITEYIAASYYYYNI
jgi:hypothetical protein